MSTPASWAAWPVLAKPSDKSLALTAKACSTATNLFKTWVVVIPLLEKPLTVAVNAATEASAPNPANRVNVKASLVLFKVSSASRPWRENSSKAFEASLNEVAVLLLISNKALLN